MVPATTHLIGFSGETIWPLGQIALLVKIGNEVHSTSAWMNFMVIRSPSQHNAIIGRSGIRKISPYRQQRTECLKFPVEGGTVTLQSSRVIPMECAMIFGPSIQTPASNQVLEEKINIAIHPEYPEQTVAIGSTIKMKKNTALKYPEGYSPLEQKKRGQAPERNKAIQEEHGRNLAISVDFKDLNNACPKDCYPLPEIDWKVESLCGYSFKCFLDAYKGYHQIKMAKEDEEKTAFITSQGIFCYSKMPFGLKNAGSTFQLISGKGIPTGKLDLTWRKIVTFFQNLEKLHKKSDFQWTPEAEEAFKQMKKLIAKLPTLTAPKGSEEFTYTWLEAKEAISAVLMTDREGRQIPVYFVRRTLRGPEVNYTPMEKLVLALLSASKRLKRYFQAHTVVVITNQPIKQLLSSSEISGRMLKWKFELEGYDILYRPRTAIKGQILADFIAERPEEESPNELMAEPEEPQEPWTLFTDGSSYIDAPGGIAGPNTNNSGSGIHYICHEVLVEELKEKSINEEEILDIVEEEGNTWMTPIREYLTKEILPEDKKKARAWGIDIAGPFPEGPGKVKFLIVAIDYFTKWIEAKAIATITGNQVKKFVWDNIVCRFGLPGEIISDNGKQFRDNPFKDWFERANRSLGEGIKARLDERSRDWIEELPHVLWAHRTMIKSKIDQAKNNEALGINLDLIEERREQAAIQEAKSKKIMEKYYNSRVRGTSFKPGDMVYRSNEATHAKDGGKLGPKWEGPYEVKESLGKGSLQTQRP
ncbi:reverse transcriptase domain-containing protein [Tanacetum coccineum]